VRVLSQIRLFVPVIQVFDDLDVFADDDVDKALDIVSNEV
jgi:hypothetical protein